MYYRTRNTVARYRPSIKGGLDIVSTTRRREKLGSKGIWWLWLRGMVCESFFWYLFKLLFCSSLLLLPIIFLVSKMCCVYRINTFPKGWTYIETQRWTFIRSFWVHLESIQLFRVTWHTCRRNFVESPKSKVKVESPTRRYTSVEGVTNIHHTNLLLSGQMTAN